MRELGALYGNTGIDTRYSCQPSDWYYQRHGWEARTEVFQHHALALLEEVAHASVAAAGISLDDIDALIVNTITGLAIPSLDAMLMNRLELRSSVERLPIFGLGCGGGVAGLARAARYAHAMPGGHVLFLTVDLCSLCLRIADPSMAMFVSAALFGDGAAGVVLRNVNGADGAGGRGRVLAVGDHFWPNTERIMGWDIKEDGFGVVLSPELPGLLRKRLLPALRGFLDANGLSLGEFAGFLLHPGGAKILEHRAQAARAERRGSRALRRRAARFRQHVLAHGAVRARPGRQGRRQRPASAGRFRPGLLRLFRRGRSLSQMFGRRVLMRRSQWLCALRFRVTPYLDSGTSARAGLRMKPFHGLQLGSKNLRIALLRKDLAGHPQAK